MLRIPAVVGLQQAGGNFVNMKRYGSSINLADRLNYQYFSVIKSNLLSLVTTSEPGRKDQRRRKENQM
jgi:hypothetical protein